MWIYDHLYVPMNATMFALLFFGVTASALPASQAAGVQPKPAPITKIGRPTPIIFHSPATAPFAPRPGNAMKPAAAKPAALSTSAAIRPWQSKVGSSGVSPAKPAAAAPVKKDETPAKKVAAPQTKPSTTPVKQPDVKK